ncbi:elongation of very long chain fatty acids protein 1-like [Stomoxys calcitrans]|nr:elongation of very long chain fatty acids protein 1-like [Stomoxys calcitrans]
MVTTICLYIYTVLKIGPRFMANRKPYKIDGLMQIYNVVQILLNSFIFYEFFCNTILRSDFSLTCEAYNPEDMRPETMKLARPVILYAVSKYLDWFDTIFFLLRKKFNQISFLHVYHHSIMVVAIYIYSSKCFAAQGTCTGLVNSFIHIVMYLYYLVSASKPNIDLLPWKKLLTQMQLLQFCLVAVQFGLPLINNWCGLNELGLWIVFLQNLFMIALFSNFYYKAYIRPTKKTETKAQ